MQTKNKFTSLNSTFDEQNSYINVKQPTTFFE